MGATASPVRAQQGAPIDSLAYQEERNRLQEAQEAHLQALQARLARQAASQGSVSANATAVTFTVNTTDDVDDGTCDGVHCSLREAIHAANATAAEDEIAFNIGAGGVQTIAPTSALPAITQPVILDGTTQPGHVANPIIELNGTGAGLTADGLVITAAGSTIRGLVIRLFAAPGIVLDGAGAFDNHIEGNFIGTNISGTSISGNGFAGILIQDGAHDNVIGGTTAGARNVISGNSGYGILITNNTTTANRVEGNFIGTNATGTSALGNGNDGVRIDAGPDANIIGGAASGAGNVLSGNGADGLEIHGGTSTDNRIEGNFIGTDATGTAAIPNNHQGVVLQVNSFNNIVGGTAPGAGNLISGNNKNGVYLNHITTAGNRIEGNFIGTDVTGMLDLGNGFNGVNLIFDTSDNAIGGTAPGAGNVIAFNGLIGVSLDVAGTGNAILGNSIFENGTVLSRLGIDLGENGATPNDPGDADTGPNKLQNFPDLTDALIINNGDLLVTYLVDTDLVNASYPLAVEFFKADVDNEEGQTFLGRDAYATADHGGCGPPPCAKTVNLGNAAALGVVPADHLDATATDDDGNTSEFSTPRQVEPFLVTNTNNSGTGSLRQVLTDANSTPNVGEPDKIRFNIDAQTDPGCNSGTGVCTIAVTSVLPTITEAVVIDGETQAGADCGNDIPSRTLKIVIDGSGAGGGVDGLKITGSGSTARGLVINQFQRAGIVLTGSGSTNNVIACNFVGTDVTGTLDQGNRDRGVRVEAGASNNIIGGTTPDAGNLLSGNGPVGIGSSGILLFQSGTTGNLVQGNFIGTDITGSVSLGNTGNGITLLDVSGNTVGGAIAGAANLISGNGSTGLFMQNAATTNNTVEGNLIGTDLTGTVAIGNDTGVVLSIDPSGNTIAGNVIAGNSYDGVIIDGPDNVVKGNFIGTDATGVLDLGNSRDGIRFGSRAVDNTIGGTVAGAGNTIAFNDEDGLSFLLSAGTGNAVMGNSIFQNGQLGIDLGNNGPTPNDPADTDASPNKFQNFPDLITAFISGSGDLHLTYSIDTDLVNATYPLTAEFFRADADDEEGQRFLGRDTYSTTDHGGCGTPPCAKTVNLGNATALGVAAMDHLVATATDDDGNTSEFSASHITSPITRYVATDGSDNNNDCSNSLDSCATLAHAVSQANDGDIIDLAAGTYSASGLLIEKNLIIQGQGVVVQ